MSLLDLIFGPRVYPKHSDRNEYPGYGIGDSPGALEDRLNSRSVYNSDRTATRPHRGTQRSRQ